MDMILVNNLKFLRLKNNYSQKHIANLLNYKSYTTIQKWEMGLSEPSISVLKRLSKLYNVYIGDIISIDLSMENIKTLDITKIKEFANTLNLPDSCLIEYKTQSKPHINIKKRREQLHMSQADLANKLNYSSRSTIAKIETGENNIPQSKVMTFAKALKTTPSYIMGWNDNSSNVIILPEEIELTKKEKEDIYDYVTFIISKRYNNLKNK